MSLLKKIGMVLSAISAAVAAIAAIKMTGPSPVSAPVGGFSLDWFTTMITALGLGTTTSLPVLLPKLIELFKKYVLPLLPWKGKAVDGLVDSAQIAAYLMLLDKAKSAEETAALLTAGRASCDALRDSLFPVPVAPPAKVLA